MDPMFEVGSDGLCQFERVAMRIARALAWARGVRNPTHLHDVATQAWIIAQARRGTPLTVARLAFKRFRSGRIHRESIRSLDHPTHKRDDKPTRSTGVPVAEYARESEDPAELAAFQIDFDAWLGRLRDRQRQIIDCFLGGMTPSEVANRFGVSRGRVSQIRRALEDSWDAQFAEAD